MTAISGTFSIAREVEMRRLIMLDQVPHYPYTDAVYTDFHPKKLYSLVVQSIQTYIIFDVDRMADAAEVVHISRVPRAGIVAFRFQVGSHFHSFEVHDEKMCGKLKYNI